MCCQSENEAINLIIDATYFGREYGYLCFHDTKRIIYFHEIEVETSIDIKQGLIELKSAGFRIKSVTIDGRKGYEEAIRDILGPVPIQLCLFHANAIVRRYVGNHPNTDAGKDLLKLVGKIKYIEPENFVACYKNLEFKHRKILSTSLVKHSRTKQTVRIAYRFVDNNMHRVFTFKDFPDLNIPTTTNHLEGLFSHLKEKINIHRGLSKNNKKNAIKFFLSQQK